jgi:hypothetical protein
MCSVVSSFACRSVNNSILSEDQYNSDWNKSELRIIEASTI